jgi:Ni,Fe-hydrogenase III large subunit
MAIHSPLILHNGQTADRNDLPVVPIAEFRDFVIAEVQAGHRISSLFAIPLNNQNTFRLIAVLTDDRNGSLLLLSADVENGYPAMTPECIQAHMFEREIFETTGIVPEGHPWLKPVRFPLPSPGSETSPAMIGITDFFSMNGSDVHEVAVGPVHAGIIEPGHFRFQCHGEKVFHLEISLGYQHRGIERGIRHNRPKRLIHYMETIAGDTTIGHATAYCQLIEALSACPVSGQVESLRGIALELERIANHVGDLGALSGDIGFLPTASYCGRIRGDFLNATALICGNRFGRGLVRPGGTCFGLEKSRVEELASHCTSAFKDATGAIELLWHEPLVLDRFEDTGIITPEVCHDFGLVGPAARACGIEQDIRFDHSSGIYRFSHIPISTWHTGDVFSRAYVRWLEIQRSFEFIMARLDHLAGEAFMAPIQPSAPNKIAASMVEGWRGEICHVAFTDNEGKLEHYKIVDPSFHNWSGLTTALRGMQISDFPLCNKSFNLSYCGFDL